VLLRKLDRMVYPNKTKLRNWMSGVNQDDAPSAETGQSNLGSTVAIDLTASLPNTVQQDITAADEWPVYDPRKYETANQATPKASPITHQPEAELNPGIARDVHIIQDEAAVPRLSSAGVDHIHDLDTPPPYTDVAEDWASIPTPTPPSTRSTAVSTNDIATALPSGIHPFAPAPVFQTPSIKLTLQGKPPVTRCSGVSLPGAFPLD
jgi:hypothetical protein